VRPTPTAVLGASLSNNLPLVASAAVTDSLSVLYPHRSEVVYSAAGQRNARRPQGVATHTYAVVHRLAHKQRLPGLFMSDLDMDDALPPLDLSRVPSNFISMMFQNMSLSDRLKCALVCKAWAQEATAATAATRSIILRDRIQDLSSLQRWLDTNGDQLEVLHDCPDAAVLTALPCRQLHDLLLRGKISLDSRV